MDFAAEHRFAGTPGAVADVLGDRAFYEALQLPDLSLEDVVHAGDGERPGERVVLLRYEYTGNLDPMARRLLGGERLTWTQELRLFPAAAASGGAIEGLLAFRAEAQPGLLHGDARFTLADEDSATVRRLAGDVVVALPIVGRMAEQRIVPGVLARLEIEAEAIRERVDGERSS